MLSGILASNKVTSSGISHYNSAVKTMLSMCGISILSFSDPRLKCFNRSVARNANLKIYLKAIINIPILNQILQVSASMYMGYVLKAAIVLSIFSFLRISNLVPHSMSTFHPLKQLARGDVFFVPPGAHILLKLSKTLQINNSIRILKIPQLEASVICPVKALRILLASTPKGSNKP